MKINKVEISQGRDGLWYVIAHTSSGKCHDSFMTELAARDFAQVFYGRVK